jgi:hypothetical protein
MRLRLSNATMTELLEIKPSSEWKGAFTMDGYFMRVHIKTVYDRNDPRTWPLIKSLIQTETGTDHRRSKVLPAFLAYDQTIMEDAVTCAPMMRSAGQYTTLFGTKTLRHRFRDYPLNFDKAGRLRRYPHILPHELKECKELVTGSDNVQAGSTSLESKAA